MKYLINSMNIKEILLGIKEYINNIQSDWAETDNTSYAYIKNKPKPSIITYSDSVNVGYNNAGSDIYLEIKHAYDAFTQPVLYVEKEYVHIPLYSSNNGYSFIGSTVKCSASGSSSYYKRLYRFECTQSSGALYVIDCYQKPDTGIPATDLASGVIPDVSGKEDTSNKTSDISSNKTNTTKYPTTKGVADYAEAKMTIVAASGTTLTASVDNYYLFSSEVGTLAITLTTPSDTTHITKAIFMFTTGSSPAVTFTGESGIDVFAQDGFEIEANSTYEINALFNGTAWIIAAVEINVV